MSDPFSLTGKSILVTGSSSGIGLACAQAAADEGAKVFVTGRNRERVQGALGSLAGDGHASLLGDLTVEEDVRALAEAAPPLDGIVFNAGIMPRLIPFQMVDTKHVDEVMQVNFLAPVALLGQLLRKKKIANGCSIVFITTVGVFVAPPASSIYIASKAALTGFARCVALDLVRRQIRSNCVALGYVKTDFTAKHVPQDQLDLSPLSMAEPADITGPVLFLLSDASRWITRSNLIVDGGISLKQSLGM